MTSVSEYASMMDLDEFLVRHFLVGCEGRGNEETLNDLLELKSVAEPLDFKVVREVVVRNSGNVSATIESLRSLGNKATETTAVDSNKQQSHDKHKEKGLFSWLFKKTRHHESARSPPARANKKRSQESASYPTESNINNSYSVQPQKLPNDCPSKEEEQSASSAPSKRSVGKNSFEEEDERISNLAPIACPVVKKTIEEEELSKEYNFASKSSTSAVQPSDHTEEFQRIFAQFMKSVS